MITAALSVDLATYLDDSSDYLGVEVARLEINK